MQIWIDNTLILDKKIVDIQTENADSSYWIKLEGGFAIKVSEDEDRTIQRGWPF